MEAYRYSYAPKNVVLTLGKETYELADGSVIYFFMFHDYVNRKQPVIKMSLELYYDTIRALFDNKDTAMLKMDMYEYQYNSDESSIVNTSLYWQHNFRIIPAKDKSVYITSDDSITEANVDEMRKLQPVELYLIDMTAVNWFTQKIGTVFTKTSKAAALHALLQMRGIPNGITVASPPITNNTIDTIPITLADLVENIKQLNLGYGIYSSNPIVYYDLVNLYCLDSVNPNIIMPLANDYGNITMIVNNMISTGAQHGGSYNDAESRTHFVNLNNVPTINDPSFEYGSSKFATVTTVNSNGIVNKENVANNATALLYIYEQSDQTINQAIYDTIQGQEVSIVVPNICVSCFKPYKQVMFDLDTQFTNLKIGNGKIFRISNWSISMTREGRGDKTNYIHDVTMGLVQRIRDK